MQGTVDSDPRSGRSCWLFYSTMNVLCTMICSKRSGDRLRILPWSSEKIAWRCEKKKDRIVGLFYCDNAPAHLCPIVVQQFSAKHKITLFCQPPYSPNIASATLENTLKRHLFDETRTIKKNVTHNSKNCLPELLQNVEAPMEELFSEMEITSNDVTCGWQNIMPARSYERRSDTFGEIKTLYSIFSIFM